MVSDAVISSLMDFMLAEAAAFRAFMLSVSLEMAKEHEDPLKWANEFISTLHVRIDVNEQSLGPLASRLPAHEMARKTFDHLGSHLEKILRSQAGSGRYR